MPSALTLATAIHAHGASADANSDAGLDIRVHPGPYMPGLVAAVLADGGAEHVPAALHLPEADVVQHLEDLGKAADAGDLVEQGSLTPIWAACLALDPSDELRARLEAMGADDGAGGGE